MEQETQTKAPEQRPPRGFKNIKFSDRSAGSKALRIVNLCLGLGLFVFSLCFMIYVLAVGDPDKRLLPCVGMVVVSIAPLALELIFRFKFSNFVLLFVYIYVFFAGILGCLFMWYEKTAGNAYFGYDKIIHWLFGYVGSIAGLFIICKLGDYDRVRPATVVLFCFAVSMACGACWEIIEFTVDRLFAAEAQGIPGPSGYPDVLDTMGDVIANFIGAIIFAAHYIIYRASKKNLLMGSFVSDFMNN